MKKKRPDIETRQSSSGASLWINNRWIVDASLFNEEGKLSIAHGRLKKLRKDDHGNVEYVFVKDYIDKKRRKNG